MIYIIEGAVALVAAILAFVLGVAYRRRTAEAAIGSAEEEATRILNDAMKNAEAKKKEAILEAKDEIIRSRNETEKELRERRSEVQRQEHRIQQKEEAIDRKVENLENKENKIAEKAKVVDERLAEAEQLKKSQFEMLEKISGYTAEQAKSQLLDLLDGELQHEKALKISEYHQKFKDEAETYAREMISMAIQRCAADHSSEATVSVVSLPNDEMKGRIIGREGRNIRALETATGVDLIIDDTPEAITVSSFDPVRREVARIALEKLIVDGRIHPARIEETVEKARAEVDRTIKQEGERALLEAGVHSMHPELVKLLGRLHFRTSYGQNVLNHSLEPSLVRMSRLQSVPFCCTISARLLIMSRKARIYSLALRSPRSIRKAKPLSMPYMHTTEMLRQRRLSHALFRLRMLFPPHVPVQDVRTSKAT